MIRRYPNGETRLVEGKTSISKYIGYGRQPGEVKHLSNRRKRNNYASIDLLPISSGNRSVGLDSVSSGERKRNSPNFSDCLIGRDFSKLISNGVCLMSLEGDEKIFICMHR